MYSYTSNSSCREWIKFFYGYSDVYGFMASRICTLFCLFLFVLIIIGFKGTFSIDLSLGFIYLPPSKVIVQRNQPLLLNCSGYSASEYGPLKISWLFQDIKIQDERYRTLSNGSLYLKKVLYQKKKHGIRDEGNFTCILQNNVGILVSRPITVIVSRMAKSFSFEPQPVIVREEGVARFQCQIHAVPSAVITWSHNGQMLPQNNSRFTLLPSGILQITDVSKLDMGNYRCIATNVARTKQSNEAMLIVLSEFHKLLPSEFLSASSQQVVSIAKETAVLECMARGHPSPSISWKREDNNPIPEERISVLGQGNLVIYDVKPDDAGTYICMASTKNSETGDVYTDSQHTVLTVHVPPDFLKRPESQVKRTSHTARFECSVDGIPSPSVQWFKDGSPLYINGRIQLKAGNVLVISQIVISDSGIYQCMAISAAGTSSAAARLQVNTSNNQPEPPQGLRVRTISSSSIQLFWNPAFSPSGLNIQAYTVHYLPTAGGVELQKVAVNTTQLIDNLKPYTNYTFYVRAYNGKSASEQSEAITHMTGEDVPISAPSVTLSSLSATSLHVSWDELPNDAARGVIIGYRIHYRKHNQASYNVIDGAGGVMEYTITGLQPKKKYDVRVMGGTRVGFPVLSDNEWPWVVHEMPDIVTARVPLPPVLHLTVVNATALEIKWVIHPENTCPIDGFLLMYRQQNQPLSRPIDLPSNVTKFLLTDLAPQTWYEVHIMGYNDQGEGHKSVRNILTLPEDHPDTETVEVVEPPQQLEAEPTSSTSIRLIWKSPVTEKNISYFTVRYHPVNNGLFNGSSASYIRSTNSEVVITNLMPFTLYEFAVRSHDINNQQGPFSQKLECKTEEDIPSAPRDLTWVPVDAHSIHLNWQPPKFSNGIITSYFILYNTNTDDFTHLETWQSKEEEGSELSSLISHLASNTLYYFCMRAQNKAGIGPPTPIITLNIPVKQNSTQAQQKEALDVTPQDPLLGVVLGVSIGVGCIIICSLIIICRNRCCPPPPLPDANYSTCCSNGRTLQLNGHPPGFGGEKRASTSDCQELDCFTPMLTHLPSGIGERHLDTKGGYPPSYCNGHANGLSHNSAGNGHVLTGSSNNHRFCINITENPQFAALGPVADSDDCLPIPKHRVRYTATDCKMREGWGENDNQLPTLFLLDKDGSDNQAPASDTEFSGDKLVQADKQEDFSAMKSVSSEIQLQTTEDGHNVSEVQPSLTGIHESVPQISCHQHTTLSHQSNTNVPSTHTTSALLLSQDYCTADNAHKALHHHKDNSSLLPGGIIAPSSVGRSQSSLLLSL